MKALIMNRKITVSILAMYSVAFFVSLILPTTPALATDFGIGTQFGISHLMPVNDDDDGSVTTTGIPSTPLDVGNVPGSLYAAWFPNKQFAIGPEFKFGTMSVSTREFGGDTSVTVVSLAGRAAYFLRSHAVSSPFLLGRISLGVVSIDDDSENFQSLGVGFGYQWRVRSALILRIDGLFQRLIRTDEESANEFRFVIGLGTRLSYY
jgi:hypothetical protein